MLSILHQGQRLCDGITRREWLRVGGLGVLGLSLPELLRSRAQASAGERGFGKAKACIVMVFLGGPPQHETWDPKPEAPWEIRGDLGPIASAVPGFHVGELMPRTARLTNHIALLRAMVTGDNAHSSSGYAMTTGRPHRPLNVENAKPGAPNDWPCLGGMIKALRPGLGQLPAAVTLPERIHNDGVLYWPGQDGGFLGRSADPWTITADPASPNFQIPGLGLPAEVPPERLGERRALVDVVDRRLEAVERSGAPARYDQQSRQVFEWLRSPRARRAFDLEQEPQAMRDRYGRSTFGQSVLLARRLVEAGVTLVQVNWVRVRGGINNGHWDTHSRNSADLRANLMPPMDQGYSALLEDLHIRGLLDETLVVWMAEFGRTPRINGNGGRDHWGRVFSVALAGGGVQGGVIHGASDRIASDPRDGRVGPHDLTATIFHCLGHRPDTEVHDITGRPLAISRGDVIRQIL